MRLAGLSWTALSAFIWRLARACWKVSYKVLLTHHLQKAGLRVRRQVAIPIEFESIRFDEGFRADLVVEDNAIVELKSVEAITSAHKKQVLTYLRLTGMKLGYLLNFGAPTMKDGIYRIINGEIKQNLYLISLCLCVSV